MAHKYKQLNIEEREVLQAGLWEGKSLRDIARRLGRDPSTLSREVERNGGVERKTYAPRTAQKRADERIRKRGSRPRLKNQAIRDYTVKKLKEEDYSPEQIAGTLPQEHPGHSISPEAIYQFIYAQYQRGGWGKCIGEDLRMCLKRKHKIRKPKLAPFTEEKGPIKNRIFIEERPKEVKRRKVPGHWEGDSMVSRQSSV